MQTNSVSIPDEVMSYEKNKESLTHLQNSIRLRKIWKSLGTLGWSPTTGSDNDTCSVSTGETGASVVAVLVVTGTSSPYWMMELNNVFYIIYKHIVRVIVPFTVYCIDIKKGVSTLLMKYYW